MTHKKPDPNVIIKVELPLSALAARWQMSPARLAAMLNTRAGTLRGSTALTLPVPGELHSRVLNATRRALERPVQDEPAPERRLML